MELPVGPEIKKKAMIMTIRAAMAKESTKNKQPMNREKTVVVPSRELACIAENGSLKRNKPIKPPTAKIAAREKKTRATISCQFTVDPLSALLPFPCFSETW